MRFSSCEWRRVETPFGDMDMWTLATPGVLWTIIYDKAYPSQGYVLSYKRRGCCERSDGRAHKSFEEAAFAQFATLQSWTPKVPYRGSRHKFKGAAND